VNDIRVIFLSGLDFSVGGAAQARQRAVMEGVGRHGVSTALLNIQQGKGVQWTLPTRHLSVGLRSLPWRLQVLLQLPFMLVGALRRRPDVMLCYDRDPMILGMTVLVARLLRVAVVHELTEYPDQVVKDDWYGRLTVRLFERFFVRRLAGAFVISRALETYVKTLNPPLRVARFPAIARVTEDHAAIAARPASGADFHITYTGSLSEPKDGVLSLLRAFAAIDPRALSARLSLYGHGTESQHAEMQSVIEALELGEVVALHAPVPHAKVGEILAASDLLVLARPTSRQAQGGFPTKLAEYLAAGRPVLTTVTGDIGRYLRHNVDAYLVAPGDTEAFSRAMLDAYGDRLRQEVIGQAARATARARFCPDEAAATVASWMKQIGVRT
jgi:glycosyltransferase involved in cell wall biosynthesis